MSHPLTAHTIVPLDDTLVDETDLGDAAEAPPPPPRTPVPPDSLLQFPGPDRSVSRDDLDPHDAPDAVVVYLRRAGLVAEGEKVEVVTDAPPPVRQIG